MEVVEVQTELMLLVVALVLDNQTQQLMVNQVLMD
jgi:hypothetical protein